MTHRYALLCYVSCDRFPESSSRASGIASHLPRSPHKKDDPPMSTQKSVDRILLSRARWASPVLPLLCALTLSACGTNGAASLDVASTPSSQATSAAPHSTAPSTPADEQKPPATQPPPHPGISPKGSVTDSLFPHVHMGKHGRIRPWKTTRQERYVEWRNEKTRECSTTEY